MNCFQKIIKQINIVGKLEENDGATMFLSLKSNKTTILKFP